MATKTRLFNTSTPRWSRDLENHRHQHRESAGLNKHRLKEDPYDPLAREDHRHRIMQRNKATAH
ncbi:hypothetical protein DPMN_163711 [Dreissena polymorpha]|uniref:Uncharacterized protein n=1 Tax=Dreissena polymorpha TaxID=45954 RepID=A0A9D4ETW4_DREPO|nr:hypothetical protein DPMN_163711 [Dreissena polymorpha]